MGELAAVGADGGQAHHLIQQPVRRHATRADHELHVALGAGRGPRPIGLGHGHHRDPGAGAVPGERLVLGQPDPADLRLGEGHPRRDPRVEGAGPAQQPGQPAAAREGVTGRQPALGVTDVGELQRRRAVAGRPHPGSSGAQLLVGDDAARAAGLDADPVQVHPGGRGATSDGHEQV